MASLWKGSMDRWLVRLLIVLYLGCIPQVILKDLEDCEANIVALENLVSNSATNRTQFDKLSAEWKSLYKAVQVRPW